MAVVRGKSAIKARRERANRLKSAPLQAAHKPSDTLPLPKIGDEVRTELWSRHGRKLAIVRAMRTEHGLTMCKLRFKSTGICAWVPLADIAHIQNVAAQHPIETPLASIVIGADMPMPRAETRTERNARLQTWRI